MAFILKSNEDPEVETSDSLLAVAPLKAQTSCRDEPEEAEQLKETFEPRKATSVPLDRAVVGLMDEVSFPRTPERKQSTSSHLNF